MLQQSGDHIQNQVLRNLKLHRGVQLDVLSQTYGSETMITQTEFLVP